MAWSFGFVLFKRGSLPPKSPETFVESFLAARDSAEDAHV